MCVFKHEDLPVQTIVLHTSVKGQPDKENFPDSEFDTPSSAVRPSQQIEQRDFAELRKRDSMDFSKKGFAGSVAGSSLGTLEGESDLEPQMIRVINEKFLSVDLSPDNKTFVTITRKRWIVRHTLSHKLAMPSQTRLTLSSSGCSSLLRAMLVVCTMYHVPTRGALPIAIARFASAPQLIFLLCSPLLRLANQWLVWRQVHR